MSQRIEQSKKVVKSTQNSPYKRQKIAENREVASSSVSEFSIDWSSSNFSRKDVKSNLKGGSENLHADEIDNRKHKKVSKSMPISLPKKNLTAYAFFIKQVYLQYWLFLIYICI